MIDILFAMAADPLGTTLVGVLLFSLGMYPVGLMLGSECSPCCGAPCDLCTTGELPETLTVTFSGLQDQTRSLDLISIGFQACFGSGGAAKATAPGGDRDTAAGPISGIELTSPGSGYAKRARVEPELTISLAGNEDAAFSILLEQADDACGIPTWSVSGVTITSPGTGYTYGEQVSFSPQPETTAEQTAFGTIITAIEEPTATLTAPDGQDASLSAVWGPNTFDPSRYQLDSVTVNAGGTGYIDGSQVDISVTGTTTEHWQAYAVIVNERQEPQGLAFAVGLTSNAADYTLTPVLTELTDFNGSKYWAVTSVTIDEPGEGWSSFESVLIAAGNNTESRAFLGFAIVANEEPTLSVTPVAEAGTGGTIQATISETSLNDGSAAWTISSIAVTAAGSGYVPGGTVSVLLTAGIEIEPLVAELIVNELGEITEVQIENGGKFARVGVLQSISVADPGQYFYDTGIIESVRVEFGGNYFGDTGEVESIQINQSGRYYKEDLSGTPYVATVTGEIFETSPSNGNGAIIEATVDSDPESQTFGQLTSVTIANGGDGYLAWVWENTKCCGDYYNGMPVVVRRQAQSQQPCLYVHHMCGVGNMRAHTGTVSVVYRGPDLPPQVFLNSESQVANGSTICNTAFTADQIVVDCSSWEDVTASSSAGAVATITSGGEYDPAFRNPEESTGFSASCFICCKGEEALPQEVEFEVTSNDGSEGEGVYVRPLLINFLTLNESIRWGNFFSGSQLSIGASLVLCAMQYRTEFSPGFFSQCGDTCHRKCRLDVTFQPFGIFSLFSNARNICDGCAENPLCNPYGTYTLCDLLGNSSYCPYSVTIRAPL